MSRITQADIEAAGVVGAGGAGFPTHLKLSRPADTVIINAAECEPLLHKDKEILLSRPEAVLAGLAVAMELTAAGRGIIAVKEKHEDVIDLLRPGLSRDMSVSRLRDAYPSGDEMILVYDVLGRVVPPGGIPPDVGAVVMNVETALNVASAADGPVTEKFLTVGGAVASPVTVRAPVGISLAECVAAAGGATVDDPNYLVGGVMMGYLEDDHGAPVDKRTSGVIVLASDHVAVRRRRMDWKQIARIGKSACDQCSFCTELCPRYLLGHPVEPHRVMRNLGFNLVGDVGAVGAAYCCQCNLCSMYACPEGLDPMEVCAESKRKLAEKGDKWPDPPFNPRRAALHLADRKAPMQRLMRRLNLMGFENVGPMRREPLTTGKVGIRLKQHAGSACVPVVSEGELVSAGDVVADVPKDNGKAALGAPVHASIAGRVAAVDNDTVWIEKE